MGKAWLWLKANWQQATYFISILTAIAGWFWRERVKVFILKLRDYRQIANDYPSLKAQLTETLNQLAEMRQLIQLSALRWEVSWQLSDVGVYECAPDGSCTFANHALCMLFGLSESEMKGNGWLNAVGRNQTERMTIWQIWQDSVKNNVPYKAEYWVVPADSGEAVYCVTYAKALRSPDTGQVLKFHGVVKPHPTPPRNSKDA